MFEIGFLEFLLVIVISILILGPKRLPEAVKMLAKFFIKISKQFQSFKQEMSKSFEINEVYQDLRNEEVLKDIDSGKKRNKTH
tara:strand:- start:16235 stop:16483 length:249 start_codon:yes stop_codon:yes gene_type:complete